MHLCKGWPDCSDTDRYQSSAVPTYGICQFLIGSFADITLTLDRTPNEVQKDPLQQRNVTSTESPCVAVLYREANMPPKSTPRDQCGEESDQKFSDNNHHHTLTDRKSICWPDVSAKYFTRGTPHNLHRKVLGVCQFETFSEFSVQ